MEQHLFNNMLKNVTKLRNTGIETRSYKKILLEFCVNGKMLIYHKILFL